MRPCRQIVPVLLLALLFVVPVPAHADVMYWGALVKGDAYGLPGEAPTSAAVLDKFEDDAGKKITIVNTGQSWASFDPATMNAAIVAGAIPLVTMPLGGGVTLEEVADGDRDGEIIAWAQAAKAFGYPFLFRPWWEMNGGWYSWGQDPYFVRAWQHFHEVVVGAGATNVTWAWVVNTIYEEGGQIPDPPQPYYPGSKYIDWVGVDAYNWGRNPLQPDRWVSAEESIEPTLEVLEEIAPGKPVCICESASTEYGEESHPEQTKAGWIHEMLDEYLPSHPRIKAYVWFNWNVEQGGYGSGAGKWDWPIESSNEAEAAFRDGIQSETFLSVLPPLIPLAKVPMPAWPPPPPADASQPPSSGSGGSPPSADRGQAPPGTPQRGPSITLGASRPSDRLGGAILPITVTGPGQLRLSGRGLRIRILPSPHLARAPLSRWIDGASELRLEVRAAGVKLRQLKATNGARLALTVRFTPEGDTAQTATRRLAVIAAG
jgi:hypothetical protein